MPYSMAIYPDEKRPVPSVGDLFKAVEVHDNVLDFHWGRCVSIRLEPVEEGDERGIPAASEG